MRASAATGRFKALRALGRSVKRPVLLPEHAPRPLLHNGGGQPLGLPALLPVRVRVGGRYG